MQHEAATQMEKDMTTLRISLAVNQAYLLREILKRVSLLDDRVLEREHKLSAGQVRNSALEIAGIIDDEIETLYRGHDSVAEK